MWVLQVRQDPPFPPGEWTNICEELLRWFCRIRSKFYNYNLHELQFELIRLPLQEYFFDLNVASLFDSIDVLIRSNQHVWLIYALVICCPKPSCLYLIASIKSFSSQITALEYNFSTASGWLLLWLVEIGKSTKRFRNRIFFFFFLRKNMTLCLMMRVI